MKDGQRLVGSVVNYLEKAKAPGAAEFKKLASSMIPVDSPIQNAPRRSSDNSMAAPVMARTTPVSSVSRKQSVKSASRYSTIACSSEIDFLQRQESARRATLPNIAMHGIGKHSNHSQSSLEPDSPVPRREYRTPVAQLPSPTNIKPRTSSSSKSHPNLDYLSLSNTPSASQQHSPVLSRTPNNHTHTPNFALSSSSPTALPQQKMSSVTPAEWESLLSSLDGGVTNIYDAVYGGPAPSLSETLPSSSNIGTAGHPASLSSSSTYGDGYTDWDLSPESWDMAALSMADFEPTAPQSVLSFSEESLSSGDDLGSSEFGAGNGNLGGGMANYRNALLSGPVGEGFLLDGLDGNFGL